jgi:KipI family sensor histidine kinase inhibitor
MAGWAQIQPVGDGAIRIAFGDAIDNETIARVWAVRAALDRAFGSSVLDIVAAFASILIRFDPGAVRLPTVMATARGVLEHATVLKDIEGRVIHVKVCFHEPYALDLVDIATQTRMRPEEVVREFCRPHYRVAFLGFTAGFPYLTGLSPALDLPRLRTPRVRVPAGSVAIAGGQCGVYPRTSPGGWRVLGRTSATIFDPDRNPPALFAPADRVHFHPVDSLDAAVAEAES